MRERLGNLRPSMCVSKGANRFLLANSICEELDPAHRDEIRKKLIILVAEAPLLSLDLVEHGDLREIQGSESGAT